MKANFIPIQVLVSERLFNLRIQVNKDYFSCSRRGAYITPDTENSKTPATGGLSLHTCISHRSHKFSFQNKDPDVYLLS